MPERSHSVPVDGAVLRVLDDGPVEGPSVVLAQSIMTNANMWGPQFGHLSKRGYRVLVAGSGMQVEGVALTRRLGELGFGSLFLLAGPRLLETMLRGGMLSRLYLTLVHRLLGGESVQTMISGAELGSAGKLRLGALYHDPTGPDGASQWFARFDAAARTVGSGS